MKKTTFIKQSEVTPRWFLVDASNQVLGRIATQVAIMLRGKNKSNYTPHIVNGDYVVIINAEKVKLTGNKLQQKLLRWHSGWRTGLKEKTYDKFLGDNPEKLIEKAVYGMLPNNKLRKETMSHLKVFRGSEHAHSAQKPELIKL
jgi:large subunit ribosomal protein L13